MRQIPFNKPYLSGNELKYIAEAVNGSHTSGDGPFTHRCQRALEQLTASRRAMLTTSCTAALEMAAILFDVKPGDEVIVPSFTYVSTANAFFLHGARIRFVDIRPDTLNIDETKIEAAITDRTRAIVPVHYAAVAAEMGAIMEIARRRGVRVVEDAAHALGATHEGRQLGSIGHLGALSFHETKNITCGEGGALLVNDPALIERAEIIRQKGTDRTRFLNGMVDKYTWQDVGSSFLPSDILAAFLFAQIEKIDEINSRRGGVFRRYYDALKPLAQRGLITLPHVPDTCCSSHHMFYMLLEDQPSRDALIAHLGREGVHAVFHFLPLHLSPVGRGMGYKEGDFPVAESASGRLVRLPFFNELAEDDQMRVVELIFGFFEKR